MRFQRAVHLRRPYYIISLIFQRPPPYSPTGTGLIDETPRGLFSFWYCFRRRPLVRRPIRFEHLTINDGLPENSVRAIVQDRSGFLWFATQNGVARYDGTG